MPDYSKPRFSRSSFSTKKSFGNKSFGSKGTRFDRGPKEMYNADCSKCGDACEVPFRPNGMKPVHCKKCFVKDDGSHFPRREFSARPSFNNDRPAPRPDQAFNDLKAELRVVNQNLERLIALMTTSVASVTKVSKKKAD